MLLGMVALGAPGQAAHAASPVDCSTVEMDFADAAATKKCRAGDSGSNLWRGSEQIMSVQGAGYFIFVRRVKSGYQSYITAEEVSAVADELMKELFQTPSPIASHAVVSGYDVATFSGKLALDPHPDVDCFAFSRYGGMVNPRGGFGGAPGYANGVVGGYCAKRTQGISDSRIQRVLTELRVPLN
jgi:hypothetical protein